ncbi:MAG: T9SS type A sorting domain-containing protein [Bacteroidetes bacterium]|nr:T9SS type A sorting domain-containing protein [Bacteroidota bacterium]
MNKYLFLSLFCYVICFIPRNADAQTARNKQKTHVAYRDNYQRMATSASAYATFEIRNGQLYACGYNLYGQLGIGSTPVSQYSLVQVGSASNWVAVQGAYEHSIGLRSDGTLWAAGDNTYGQLGIGSTTGQTSFVQVGTDNKWTSISCNTQFSLAIKSDGTLWAWGYNTHGQLGIGSTTNQSSPVQVGTSSNWVSVQAGGEEYAIGLKSDGTLWAWGRNIYGQLGDGTTTDRTSPVQIGSLTNWISIATGFGHSIAIRADGTLWAWGHNNSGQLGIGNTTNQSSPVQVGTANTWVMVAGGGGHTLALKVDGTLWSWGDNSTYGQLGIGSTTSQSSPVQVGSANTWVSIAAGGFHSLALKADGTLYSWGGNPNGAMGFGSAISSQTVPTLLSSLTTDWLQISTGDGHTLALKSDGTLWAWGRNSSGQLGIGSTTQQLSAVQVGTATNWISVSAGGNHSLALKSDGTLWAWGWNGWGQLGIGSTTNQSSPVQVGSATTWKCISTGYYHSMAVRNDGTIWGWGYGLSSQLGIGSSSSANTPTQGGSNTTWVSVSGGADHSMALRSDGTLWATGSNGFGDIGQSSATSSVSSWTQIGSATNWISGIAGGGHSIALQANGDLYTWGWNLYGEVGIGSSTTVIYTPQLVASSSTAIQICAKWHNASYIKSDGTMKVFGYNAYGQLGDGTTTNRNVPVTATGVTDAVTIAANSLGNVSDGIIRSYRTELCLTGYGGDGQLGNGATNNRSSFACGLVPSITTNPSNNTICAGSNTSFTVAASNSPTSYTWQVNTGSGYTNVSNSGVYSNATTATLTITAAPTTMNGYLYRVIATNAVGNSLNSTAATLTVNPLTAITTNPSNATICASSNTTFTVAASGTPTSYTWQVNTGSGYTNISNGGVYSTATSATLNITGATSGMDGYLYRAIANNGCGSSSASTAAILTISPAPSVVTDPSNSTICSGSNTTFVVSANNTTGYQWYVQIGVSIVMLSNSGFYSGVTTNTLTITGADATLNGNKYYCILTNACTPFPGVASAQGTLTVNSLPAITTQPSNSSIASGNNTSFTVVATGTGLAYQWQENTGSAWTNVSNGGIYSNASTATLNLTGVTFAMNGYQYRCYITGTCTPAVTSNAATITVSALVPLITTNPSNSTVCSPATTSFTVAASNSPTSYTWQVNSGSGYTNILNGGVYSNATTATLNISNTTGLNGYLYRAIATNADGSSSPSSAATLTVNIAPTVTTNPSNASANPGNNTSFTVTASGTSLTYQWQENTGSGFANVSNGGIYSNATTATLNLTGVTLGMNGYTYRCVVSGTCSPSATSTAATLTVSALTPTITTNPSNSIVCSPTATSFTITASNTPTSYTWQVNSGSGYSNISNGGVYSNATTATLNISNTTGLDGYLYRAIATNGGGSSSPSSSATLTVSTAPSVTTQPSNSSVLSGGSTSFTIAATGTALTYQWQENTGSTWVNVTNGGIYSNATTATLNLTGVILAMNNYQYRCIITGTCTPIATSNAVTLSVGTPFPAITTNPSNNTACAGSIATFTVTASNTPTGYTWQENTGSGYTNVTNGGAYSRATTASLSIATTISMSGYLYRAIATNAGGSSSPSTTATLTVNALPAIISQPSNASVLSGSNATFTVVANGSGINYQWQENTGSSWINIINGGVYSGSGNAILTLTAVPLSMNGYQYRCIITGTCSPSATSNAATLSVGMPAPVITTNPANSTTCTGSSTSFTVAASNSPSSYTWQVNTGSGFTNVSNGGVYSNASTATLNITGATIAMTGYLYRAIATNGTGSSVPSNAGSLTVNSLPSISTQPVNSTICSGNSTSFSIVASGTAITYQWQESTNGGSSWSNLNNIGVYNNVTTSSMSISATTISMSSNLYRCTVGGSCTPAAISSNAILTVNSLPVITSNPSNSTICSGGSTVFSVTATGTSITYQWQESINGGSTWLNLSNTGVYSNTTTNTMSITGGAAIMNAYQYRCIVTGACSPTAISSAAILTINTAPGISSNPSNASVCPATAASFTIAATGTSVSYQWQENTGSSWNNITNGGIYSGATTTTLNISSAVGSMTGYLYRCALNGTCSPSVLSNAASLTVLIPVTITGNPTATTVCVGANANFTANATGSGVTYQWQESTNGGTTWNNLSASATYTNVTSSALTIITPPNSMSGYVYSCSIRGTCTAPSNTNTAILTVNTLPNITANPTAVTVCEGTSASMSITATGTGISYQWQFDAGFGWNNCPNVLPYTGLYSNTLSFTNPPTTINGYLFRCVATGTCTPPAISGSALLTVYSKPAITSQPSTAVICNGANASFSINATGTGISYQWQQNTGTGWTNLTNTAPYSNTTAATLNLTIPGTAIYGYQFRCVVLGTCSPAAVSNPATLYVNSPAGIGNQPFNKTVCEGSPVTFNITPTGFSNTGFTYQWQVNNGGGFNNLSNGTPYSNVTTPNLTISPSNFSMNGSQYRCVVATACAPAATSNAAVLTVNQLVTLGPPPVDKTVCPGVNTTFNVTATGTGLIYQWQANSGSGFTNIINNATYTGANTPILNVIAAPNMNNYQFRCYVTGDCPPPATSGIAVLRVLKPIAFASQTISDSICEGDFSKVGVVAVGKGLTYQWQIKLSSGNYADLPTIPPFSGENRDSLSITNAPDTLLNRIVRCKVSETLLCNSSQYSDDIPIFIYVAPSSTPSQLTTSYFGTAIFNVPTGLASYQWQENSNDGAGFRDLSDIPPYSGVNTPTLTVSPVGYQHNGYYYRCVVDGACYHAMGSKQSMLIVDPALSVVKTNIPETTIKIYPNPLEGNQLSISFSKATTGSTEVKIMDKLGKMIYENTIEINTANISTIDLKELAAGVYMLQIVNEHENIRQTINFTKQ